MFEHMVHNCTVTIPIQPIKISLMNSVYKFQKFIYSFLLVRFTSNFRFFVSNIFLLSYWSTQLRFGLPFKFISVFHIMSCDVLTSLPISPGDPTGPGAPLSPCKEKQKKRKERNYLKNTEKEYGRRINTKYS